MSKISDFKKEFDKGMPVSTYIKKKYNFDNIDEFEKYIHELQEKAEKYDNLISEDK